MSFRGTTEAVQSASIVEEAETDIDLGFFQLGQSLPLVVFHNVSFTSLSCFLLADGTSSNENLSEIWVNRTTEATPGCEHRRLLDFLPVIDLKALFKWVLAIDILGATNVEQSVFRQANHFILATFFNLKSDFLNELTRSHWSCFHYFLEF